MTPNFVPHIWAASILGNHEARVRYALTHHGIGFLHEPPERVLRIRRRRRQFRSTWLQGGWKYQLAAWWYRVRAPLRRLGGCHEDER